MSQSWNLYAFVRNNPLRYADPTGEKIYVGALAPDDLQELLNRVNATYGCTACVTVDNDDFLAVDTSGLTDQVRQATQYLTDAINSTTFFAQVEVANNAGDLAFGETRINQARIPWRGTLVVGSLIRLDFRDDRWVGGDRESRRVFLDTVFAHEVAHVFPTIARDPANVGQTGPVVDTVNNITDALGRPRRTAYLSNQVGGHWLALPFSRREIDRQGHVRERAVQITWLRRNVGGRGVN